MNRERTSHQAGALALAALLAVGILLVGARPAAAALPMTQVASGHSFSQPLYVTHAGDARLFVVQQRGLIKIIHPDQSVTNFLDLSGFVSQSGGERGLLGLAFHPNYASNGLFYVNFTRASDGATVIREYRRSAGNPNVADPSSGRRLLVIRQPASNHNGGWMGFKGPYMYIATGDGGGDPAMRAQNLNKLLGKILRIDPLDPPGSRRYSIPAKNPYVGRDGRDEIWAYGLRNPWRCSFDRGSGRLWCADVGQQAYEEINRSRTGKGVNYGWQLLEGFHYYRYPGRPAGDLCTSNCRTLPIAEYAHSAFGGGNCSVTGGYVSRRTGAALHGQYVFGDFCSGRIWTIPAGFAAGGALPSPAVDTDLRISSFGEGADGRLYIVDLSGGRVFRLDES